MSLDLNSVIAEASSRTGAYDRIVLHIGMHKTGSTTIQRVLKGFDDGRNLYAPFEHINHSFPIYTIFSKHYLRFRAWTDSGLTDAQIEELRARQLQDLIAMLRRRDRQTLILSGESIGQIHAEGVAQMIDLMRPHTRKIEMICYVRAPLSFAVSSFQQRMKRYLTGVPNRVDPQYRSRIEKFIELLGRENVTIRLFDRSSLMNGDVAQDFADFCGITLPERAAVEANSSLSAPALKLLYHFNRERFLKAGDDVLSKAREQLISRLARSYADGPRIELERFSPLAVFDDVEWLRQTCGIDFVSTVEQTDNADLKAWLDDLSDVDPEPLQTLLSGYGLKGRYPELPDQVCRLFYHLIHLQQSRVDADKAAAPAWKSATDSAGELVRGIGVRIGRP